MECFHLIHFKRYNMTKENMIEAAIPLEINITTYMFINFPLTNMTVTMLHIFEPLSVFICKYSSNY